MIYLINATLIIEKTFVRIIASAYVMLNTNVYIYINSIETEALGCLIGYTPN